MKITSGQFKNRNFYMPAEIRPTQNIVRKAVFDILGQDLDGMAFLDLFAGSGAVGIEAISVGAEKTVMVERSLKCYETIRENLEIFRIDSGKFDLMNGDSFASIKALASRGKRFDVVFSDPPYGLGLAKKTLKTLNACDIFKPNCTIIIEHSKDEILPENEGRIVLFKRKKYGKSVLSIYEIEG